ncbi:MAG: DUF2061 domain-containing protein [Deltaproteobacteria bacterium]|nr:DUF2061 domain-containing protein [Deltaproteobacteria bacterium]
METHQRTLLKSVSWRVVATLVTMITALALTGRLDFALGIGSVDAVAKLGLYYLHERAWARVAFGLAPPLGGNPPVSVYLPVIKEPGVEEVLLSRSDV